MKNIKSNNMMPFLYLGSAFLLIILIYFLGKKDRDNKNNIEAVGVETVGRVINRTYRYDKKAIFPIAITFDFFFKDSLIRGQLCCSDIDIYEEAIVGMKYKVKYLKGNPKKDCIIDIYAPVITEYNTIGLERLKIKESYENGRVFVNKNARPLNEIQHLIP